MSFQVASYQSEGYLIDTEVYQGPLDLLLELIEKAELDITKLALAQVTDQYLDYMHQLQLENPAEVSAFLVIASRLLQIKSLALLPRQADISGVEEEDPGEALARQLILYKRFKEVANLLAEREIEGLKTYLRMAPPPKLNIQPKLDISELTLDKLIQAANEILKPKQNLANLDTVVNLPRVTIRERIQSILSMISYDQKSSFNLLLGNKYSRIEIVVTFLALLELVKRHILVAKQDSLFGNIELAHQENNEFAPDDEIEFEE